MGSPSLVIQITLHRVESHLNRDQQSEGGLTLLAQVKAKDFLVQF